MEERKKRIKEVLESIEKIRKIEFRNIVSTMSSKFGCRKEKIQEYLYLLRDQGLIVIKRNDFDFDGKLWVTPSTYTDTNDSENNSEENI